jgi:hypothetical protein
MESTSESFNPIINNENIDGIKYKYKLTKCVRIEDNMYINCNLYQVNKPKTFSMKVISYLNYISSLKDIYIKNAINGGEYRISNTRYFVDGYHEKTNTVYEFHGTVYHGDPRVCDQKENNYLGFNYSELYRKTIERENEIKELGYNLVVMWEYDWDNYIKSIIIIQQKYRKNK